MPADRGGDDAGLVRVFRLTTSRSPTDRELPVLRELLASARSSFAGKTDEAKTLVGAGEAPRDDKLDPIEQAAWTSVIQTLLSFDECLTKR